MKTRIRIYYRYGAWRVQVANVGALYDIRRIHTDLLQGIVWCDFYNTYGYAPVEQLDGDTVRRMAAQRQLTYQD